MDNWTLAAKELDYAFYKAADTLKTFGAQLAATAERLEAAERKARRQRRIYRRAARAWLRRQYL